MDRMTKLRSLPHLSTSSSRFSGEEMKSLWAFIGSSYDQQRHVKWTDTKRKGRESCYGGLRYCIKETR